MTQEPISDELHLGDIRISGGMVFTPQGQFPLQGSQWTAQDLSRTDRVIPTYAIVLAIVFALLCLLGLLFLLIQEDRTTGFVQVTVRSGSIYHATQIPVFSPWQVSQVFADVGWAQAAAG